MLSKICRLLAFFVCVALFATSPADAQTRSWWLGGVAEVTPAAPTPTAETTAVDFEAWGRFVTQAEAEIAESATSSDRLETLRNDLANWRERLLAAQTANALRIDTLQGQLTALGPAPEGEAAEPEEISARRVELTEQLAAAQAPRLAAEEAWRRADALIREADRILRARDANLLLRRDPAPANPANWGLPIGAATQFGIDLATELRSGWNNNWRRDRLISALPVVLLAAGFALVMLWQGRRWINLAIQRLQTRLPEGWWGIVALPLSLTQIAFPFAALAVMATVLGNTSFLGPLSTAIVADGLVNAGLAMAVVLWIGWHIFPAVERSDPILDLPAERRAEGRFHVSLIAITSAAEQLVAPVFSEQNYGVGATLAMFPATFLTGLLLFRLGQLIIQSSRSQEAEGDSQTFRNMVVSILGRAAIAIGIIGPVMGVIGYLGLANALVHPAMTSLGLIALLTLLQRLIYDIYAVATRLGPDRAREALFPVLASFALVLLALPVVALIWGVRSADLLEYWTTFREGFRIGETRFSPTDFILFGVIFGAGYGLTKLVQGALRTSVLPKTTIDTGARNAIVAGTGYVGYVLAALAAITSTGLDLSSLAIVAGALSVGIGFGLQNIVQNFISGIILLVERPVAEGDWVEVGGVQGIVKAISIRSTRVETFDRNSVILPNASLISGTVTNFTGFNLAGRVIIPLSVAYETDTRHVERVLREIAEEQPMVLLNPPPTVQFAGFGADGLNFELRAILRDINFSGSVKSDINHRIIQRFAEEGIQMPYAQREVRIVNAADLTGAPPAAVAAAAAGSTD